MSAVLLGLCQKGQQDIALLNRHMIASKHLQCVREIDHLGDGRWLFERIVPKRERDTSHLAMELRIRLRCAACDDLRFALWRWVFYPDIQTATANRVAQAPLFIAGQNHKRNASGLDRAKFRDRKLPCRQDLKKHCFEAIVNFVEFVDQEYAWSLALQSAHQRPRPEEIAPLEVGLHGLPVFVLAL